MMAPTLNIIHGDCVVKMRDMEEASIPLIVTSPPYDDLRKYGGHCWDFEEVACGIGSVLCDGGICCWVVGDSVVDGSETLTSAKQKIFFHEEVGLRIHDTMIYEKANPANPSDHHMRYNQCVEYIFVLTKGRPRCFNPIKDKPNVSAGEFRYGRKERRSSNGDRSGRHFSDRKPAAEFGLRSNCWRGITSAQENPCREIKHPAVMPSWLARDLILSWSNLGDTVLDPFAGSGTTLVEAITHGRNAIGIEINKEYLPLIRHRTDVTPGLAL